MVERMGEGEFEPRRDAQAGAARLLERAGTEGLLQPLAHRFEVDP